MPHFQGQVFCYVTDAQHNSVTPWIVCLSASDTKRPPCELFAPPSGIDVSTVASVFCWQAIVRVLLDEGEYKCVPLTPETTARDVIDCCRDPDEPHCTLTQVTRDGGEYRSDHLAGRE